MLWILLSGLAWLGRLPGRGAREQRGGRAICWLCDLERAPSPLWAACSKGTCSRRGSKALGVGAALRQTPPLPSEPGRWDLHLCGRERRGPRPPPCAPQHPDSAGLHHPAWGPEPAPRGQAVASLCGPGQPDPPHRLDHQQPASHGSGPPGSRGEMGTPGPQGKGRLAGRLSIMERKSVSPGLALCRGEQSKHTCGPM